MKKREPVQVFLADDIFPPGLSDTGGISPRWQGFIDWIAKRIADDFVKDQPDK